MELFCWFHVLHTCVVTYFDRNDLFLLLRFTAGVFFLMFTFVWTEAFNLLIPFEPLESNNHAVLSLSDQIQAGSVSTVAMLRLVTPRLSVSLQLFPRKCTWLYVINNNLMSLSGKWRWPTLPVTVIARRCFCPALSGDTAQPENRHCFPFVGSVCFSRAADAHAVVKFIEPTL